MAAVGSMGSVTLTWPFGETVVLAGIAITFLFLLREFIMEKDDVYYCEYRDRFVRKQGEGN